MAATTITAWAAAQADRLTAAGLPAVTDPRNAHPPIGLVVVREAAPRTAGLCRVAGDVLLIAPGIGNADAMGWLYEALPRAWRGLGRRLPGQLVVWVSPHTGQQLLAFALSIHDDIEIEEAD